MPRGRETVSRRNENRVRVGCLVGNKVRGTRTCAMSSCRSDVWLFQPLFERDSCGEEYTSLVDSKMSKNTYFATVQMRQKRSLYGLKRPQPYLKVSVLVSRDRGTGFWISGGI